MAKNRKIEMNYNSQDLRLKFSRCAILDMERWMTWLPSYSAQWNPV